MIKKEMSTRDSRRQLKTKYFNLKDTQVTSAECKEVQFTVGRSVSIKQLRPDSIHLDARLENLGTKREQEVAKNVAAEAKKPPPPRGQLAACGSVQEAPQYWHWTTILF